ncbi:methyltransferase domain-containing protein (plasmid) [Paracoccus ferrooxidans]|nr:methyltransferase domain-containing protein [Paracoccus ferrooxidans]
MRNRSVKDDIRDYWSHRAETYDQSPGHGLMAAREAAAWLALIRRHLGPGEGRLALDLGCGTGAMSLLMRQAGFAVTGLDFAGPMLERARRKAQEAGARLGFIAADAENTLEPDGRYDVIIARNLLWTLPAPQAALGDWFRILKPGGRLLVIDGDHARQSLIERALPRLDRLLGRMQDSHSLVTPAQWRDHGRIMAQLPFGAGLRARDAADLIGGAGFTDLRHENLRAMHSRRWPLWSRARLAALGQHRFAVSGRKPGPGQ